MALFSGEFYNLFLKMGIEIEIKEVGQILRRVDTLLKIKEEGSCE